MMTIIIEQQLTMLRWWWKRRSMGRDSAVTIKEMVSSLAIKCVCLLLLSITIDKVKAQLKVYNVMGYNAVANDYFDNSKVLTKVWEKYCPLNNGSGVILFPPGTFLLAPVILQRHCKGPMQFQVQGTLLASRDIQSSVGMEHWVSFKYVDYLAIYGSGSLDGRGSAWGKSTVLPTVEGLFLWRG